MSTLGNVHPGPTFDVTLTRLDGHAVLGLTGELDLAAASGLRDQFAVLAKAGVVQIVLDLSHLDFLDSTGLSVLVMGFSRMKVAGGSLVIRNPPATVMRILEITGLASVFNFVDQDAPLSPADSENVSECHS